MLSQSGVHLVGALNPLSSTSVLASLGALGVFLALFAETGLLIGFFLPGDSLLFTAGLLCTTTGSHSVHLSLPLVILAAIGGALLGAQTGYYIGRGGRPLLGHSRNRFLTEGTERAGHLLERYGYGKAIVLARFIPVVRTVLNPMAGALQVPVRDVHPVAGRRRRDLGGRRHPGRLRPGQHDPQHRHLPAADHRGDRHRLAHPDRPRAGPRPAGQPHPGPGRRRGRERHPGERHVPPASGYGPLLTTRSEDPARGTATTWNSSS